MIGKVFETVQVLSPLILLPLFKQYKSYVRYTESYHIYIYINCIFTAWKRCQTTQNHILICIIRRRLKTFLFLAIVSFYCTILYDQTAYIYIIHILFLYILYELHTLYSGICMYITEHLSP